MADVDLAEVVVRPVAPDERARFDVELDGHHWLGSQGLIGETMRYVAVDGDGRWVAVAGFGAAALACAPRDRSLGWSEQLRYRRLRHVVNNQRLCVLPGGRVPNLASAVLGRSLRRISDDWQARWGHRVVLVETFVDPSRHRGTCYLAAGFAEWGQTAGYGRRAGRWVAHGRPKRYLARPLRKDAEKLLTSDFEHPLLRSAKGAKIDLNALAFDGHGGLLERLDQIPDHRKRRGIRHQLSSLLAIATAATLSGARSLVAIGEFASDCPQPVLERLGAKFHPSKERFVAPSGATLRRALLDVEAGVLDEIVGGWLLDQVRAGRLNEDMLVVALDGKTLRGTRDGDGRAVGLFSAMVHGEGVVVGQQQIERSNEIAAFKPLLEPLDLTGALVTADALHTQREHARFVVEDKHADYLFQVKGNQPGLDDAVRAIDDEKFSVEHAQTSRGHGRLEHRHVRVAKAPTELDFPYAAQVIVVYRERATLDDVLVSCETCYYITSLPANKAGPAELGDHTRGHWGIENRVHWVRDVTFDEDRHQLRAPRSSAPRALATLRNLAISLLRLAGMTNTAAGTRWVAREPTRAAALLGV